MYELQSLITGFYEFGLHHSFFIYFNFTLYFGSDIKAHTNRAKRNGNTVFCLMATTVFLLDVLHWICMKMGCKSAADSAAVFFKVVVC